MGQEQDNHDSVIEGPVNHAAPGPVDHAAPGPVDHAALGPDPVENARLIAAAFNADTESLTSRMGIKIIEASAQRSVATMPVAGNTQPYGLLHGGASCVLAETLGSLGAALHAGPGKITVGVEINATHHRSASSGLVTAVATMAHGGNTMVTQDIVITDDQGRRVCTARLSCLLRDAVPGREPGSPTLAGDV